MNNLSITAQSLDLYLGFDKECGVIHDVPYFDICTEYLGFPLAVAFLDGEFLLCFKYNTCLRLCAYFNESFVECDIIKDFIFSNLHKG